MDVVVNVNVDRLESDVQALSQHVQDEAIGPLLIILKSLVRHPQNMALLKQLVDVFNGLGMTQGVVLAYAPYVQTLLSSHIDTLMSHDPYWNKDWGNDN